MALTPIQKREARKHRNEQQLDLNLTALIDVFTILIFFLLSSSTDVNVLPATHAVKLPESIADTAPKPTVVVTISDNEILVQDRPVALVTDAMKLEGDVIEPLRAELAQQQGKQVVLEKNQEQAKAVTIMADKDVPYRLLRKIMVTSAQANYTDVSFAVRRKFKA